MSYTVEITTQDQINVTVPFVFTKGTNELVVSYNGLVLIPGSQFDYIEVTGDDSSGQGLIQTNFPLRQDNVIVMSLRGSQQAVSAVGSSGGIAAFITETVTVRFVPFGISGNITITILDENNIAIISDAPMVPAAEQTLEFKFQIPSVGRFAAIFKDSQDTVRGFQYITGLPVPEGGIF